MNDTGTAEMSQRPLTFLSIVKPFVPGHNCRLILAAWDKEFERDAMLHLPVD